MLMSQRSLQLPAARGERSGAREDQGGGSWARARLWRGRGQQKEHTPGNTLWLPVLTAPQGPPTPASCSLRWSREARG